VDPRIRDYRPEDEDAVVALSLRAWAPVFQSLRQVLGTEIFIRLHPDWRHDQENAVRGTLAGSATRAWVADSRHGVTCTRPVTRLWPDLARLRVSRCYPRSS
jgi:hypothetical protein